MDAHAAEQIDKVLVLVRMGSPEGDIALHSGIGRYTLDGITYTGAGKLLSVAEIQNESGIEATSFRVQLARTDEAVNTAALNADLRDQPIRISLVAVADGGQLRSQQVLKQGRVSNVEVSAEGVRVDCYTPMTDLTRVRKVATHLSRAHQRQFVDADDACCDRTSENATTELNWP